MRCVRRERVQRTTAAATSTATISAKPQHLLEQQHLQRVRCVLQRLPPSRSSVRCVRRERVQRTTIPTAFACKHLQNVRARLPRIMQQLWAMQYQARVRH